MDVDVLALLKNCETQDIRLTVTDGTLHCDAPTGALTEGLRAAIAQHKGELLELLASPATCETTAAAAVPRVTLADQRTCPHTGKLYTHRDLRRTCLTCGTMLLPDAPAMEPLAAVLPRVLDRLSTCGMGERHPAVHDPRCESTGLSVTPGVGWDCPTCQQQYRVPIVPAGVLHLWSELLQDDVYGTDSLTQARALWAASQIAVYTPGELRRLRHVQRADPDTFTEKLTVIHRLKRAFGCHVDEVIIPQPQEQEI